MFTYMQNTIVTDVGYIRTSIIYNQLRWKGAKDKIA